MALKFRTLNADEIECRVQSVTQNKNGAGFILLLYKDARCDQNILDGSVGPMNWQRHHSRDNANCTVSIWDSEKSQWIEKEDTGTESNTEAAKGLASDSFKRACFNWGIGRELYTAPFIWIAAQDGETYIDQRSNKPKASTSAKFKLESIEYDDKRRICSLTIVDSRGNVRYTYPQRTQQRQQKPQQRPMNEGHPKDAKTISPSKAAWIESMCKALYGEQWSEMLQRATGYATANEIPNEEFNDIKARLEAAERRKGGTQG